MTSSVERKITTILEELGGSEQTCTICYGVGPHTVWVPEGADPDASEYTPVSCPECGTPARRVMRVLGMDLCQVEKTFGPLRFQPRPTGCE